MSRSRSPNVFGVLVDKHQQCVNEQIPFTLGRGFEPADQIRPSSAVKLSVRSIEIFQWVEALIHEENDGSRL